MFLNIPGKENISVSNVILDFNGTIAIDGKLIQGVAEKINNLSEQLNIIIVTADTNGTAESELADVNCKVINLSKSKEYGNKMDVLTALGKGHTICVGNGFNDHSVLKESVLGIAVMQEEGVSTKALMSSDIVFKSIIDALSCFEAPNRLKATLRS
ncbi:HAD family hydrolase [Thalassotalea marina]|uniref:ATPase P n=1 Tax=Thalassotalea marina TaxID=1673741 RepID=A0A919BQR9_9GAMM|nr:ATPase P [Thalassotalea marina]GHG06243.1 hypothetical protein GCM10017161_39880 [Thalassotalea marina]